MKKIFAAEKHLLPTARQRQRQRQGEEQRAENVFLVCVQIFCFEKNSVLPKARADKAKKDALKKAQMTRMLTQVAGREREGGRERGREGEIGRAQL